MGKHWVLMQADDWLTTGKKMSPHIVYETLDLHPLGIVSRGKDLLPNLSSYVKEVMK